MTHGNQTGKVSATERRRFTAEYMSVTRPPYIVPAQCTCSEKPYPHNPHTEEEAVFEYHRQLKEPRVRDVQPKCKEDRRDRPVSPRSRTRRRPQPVQRPSADERSGKHKTQTKATRPKPGKTL